MMIGSLLREPIFCFTTIKTADHRVFKMATHCSKWLPAVFRVDFSLYRHRKMATLWKIFAGRWGILPIGTHWAVFNAFQWTFYFHLMMISFYSNFAGTDYCRQVRHHCTNMNVPTQVEITRVQPHGARLSTHDFATAVGSAEPSYHTVLHNPLPSPGRRRDDKPLC